MQFEQWKETLETAAPDEKWPPLLQAMWWDARGDWSRAHEIAQDVDSEMGSLIHAYLHRQEGDDGNAGYWYRRAGRPRFVESLAMESDAIVRELLKQYSVGGTGSK